MIYPQDDNFAGRQPITFENPLYATAPAVSGDPAVIHATQVFTQMFTNEFFLSYRLNSPSHINR